MPMIKRFVYALFLSVLLTSCDRRGDQNADRFIDRGQENRILAFQELSLSERLRVFGEVYDRSGHPKDVELANGFTGNEEQVYWAIIGILMAKKHDNVDLESVYFKYKSIILQISLNGFDVCRSDRYDSLMNVIERDWLKQYKVRLSGGCFIP